MKTLTTEVIHIISGNASFGGADEICEIVYQLARQQSLAGRKVSIWHIDSGSSGSETHQLVGVKYFQKHGKKFGINSELLSALTENRGSAFFHLHGGFFSSFYSLSEILSDHNIPFVLTPHGAYNPVVMQRKGVFNSLYIRFFERKVLKRATYIHCQSKVEVNAVVHLHPTANAVLLPYGFTVESMYRAAPDKNKLILAFSGHLEIYSKGLDLLIDAFAFVKQVHPGAALWIIGDSKERERLNRQITARGLQNDVVLWGSQIKDEKLKLLSKVNMFVNPSRNEDLPSSVIEAASMGIPCVVTEASNIGAPVRNFDCGEVVEDLTETELFNAIMNLHHRISLDGFSAFSEKARHMVAKEFDWHTIVPKYDLLYQVA